MTRLPDSAYTDKPWRVKEIAGDFVLEDVWALPTPGGPDDLDRLVQQFASEDDAEISNVVMRTLFAIRLKLGALFGLDEAGRGLPKVTLRDRLPADLRAGPRGPDCKAVPFTSVFQTDTEWAAELSNKMMHVVLHLAWVPDSSGGYHGQMAALVRPTGLLGKGYMLGITPIRRAVVVPLLIKGIGRNWPKYA